MKDIKFSIMIPAYKSAFLYEAIDSCLKQTYSNFELVIVDDASPENLKAVVSKFFDNRIRFFCNEKNCGAIDVVDNWNICLRHCSGDYGICMGDDDRLEPNCLSELAKLIAKYSGLGVYHMWTELIDEKSNVFFMQEQRPEFESALALLWQRWFFRKDQFIGDFCYDLTKLKNDGGFFKLPLAWASDDISAVRAARYSGIANTQVPCFQYRVNSSTITNTGNVEMKLAAMELEKEWYRGFLSNRKWEGLDGKIYCLVHQYFDKRFSQKAKTIIMQDLAKKPVHLLKWLRQSSLYGLSKMQIVDAFLSGYKLSRHAKEKK